MIQKLERNLVDIWHDWRTATERFGQSSTPKIDLSPCVCCGAFTCFVTTLFTSFCRIGWRRHSPTSLNTEFHSYVCPRKGINISGGQKVRQLSKSVWPVGQLQTWKDWLLGVDGKSSAKVNWWNQGNPINIHECSCWKTEIGYRQMKNRNIRK